VASCDGVFLSGSLPLCEIVIILVVTDMANKLLFLSQAQQYTHQWTAPTELNTVQHNLTYGLHDSYTENIVTPWMPVPQGNFKPLNHFDIHMTFLSPNVISSSTALTSYSAEIFEDIVFTRTQIHIQKQKHRGNNFIMQMSLGIVTVITGLWQTEILWTLWVGGIT